jgi:hypothetical protein
MGCFISVFKELYFNTLMNINRSIINYNRKKLQYGARWPSLSVSWQRFSRGHDFQPESDKCEWENQKSHPLFCSG